jgi:hypothetical protein
MLDEQSVINSVGISAVIFALQPSQMAAVYAASYPYLADFSSMFGEGVLSRPAPLTPQGQDAIRFGPASPLTLPADPGWLQ